MRTAGNLKLAAALVLCTFVGAGISGCSASASVGGGTNTANTPPPPPPPPPPDNDGDGILETDDKCPDQKEDGGQPDPKDGCPNADADGDGINVPDDKCPDQPENKNGFEDEDGCPDEDPLARVEGNQIKIKQKLRFKKGSHELEGDDTMGVIKAVAQVIKDNPGFQLIEVGGHASREGDEWFNRTLTDKRAKSVVAALIAEGVEKERLLPMGYGFYCPMVKKEGNKAKVKNRRVGFKIVYKDGKRTGAKVGCTGAEAKGLSAKIPDKPPWEKK